MSHWFETVADHLGSAYLRYSFTYGTKQEVAFLIDALRLEPPMRVLDVGCGPGRHSLELARLGFDVVGVDISEPFIELARTNAPANAEFHRMDAADLAFSDDFDVVISLCQGAFGLPSDPAVPVSDTQILERMAAALRPDGHLVVSAFSAYFQVQYLDDGAAFDASTGVNHERTTLRNPAGETAERDLWTSCFTPRELRLMAERAELTVDAIYSVAPGAYARTVPTIETPEFLLIASRR